MKQTVLFLVLGLTLLGSRAEAQGGDLSSCQFVPVIVDIEAPSTRFETELSFTNPNGEELDLTLLYTSALGPTEGSKVGWFHLRAEEQLLVPHAMDFLRGLGIEIPVTGPNSSQAGTLLVCGSIPLPLPIGVMARVVSGTRSPLPVGKAGVSFPAVPAGQGFTGRASVYALRTSSADRSNVAIYNPGPEPVSVSVTLVSGASDRRAVLSAATELGPYGWKQFTNVFLDTPINEGFVVVERVSETGVFGAYGVVNDNLTNDGSFIPAVPSDDPRDSWILPVAFDSPYYKSELTLANPGDTDARFILDYNESAALSRDRLTAMVNVPARRQLIFPNAFSLFTFPGTPAGPRTSAGTLRIRTAQEPIRGAWAGVRVLTRQESGRFGVFTPALPKESATSEQGFIWGLRADGASRSNVAVLNAGGPDTGIVVLQLQAFDGNRGVPVGEPLEVSLGPGEWAQPDGFFLNAGIENGYVRVTRAAGVAPWSAYGVINDGSVPGRGTGDGSFVPIVFGGDPLPLPEGVWGAVGIGMWPGGNGVRMEGDCSHGMIEGRVFLDPLGRFNGKGTFVFEGGPTPAGGFPVYDAVFYGLREKDQLAVNMVVQDGLIPRSIRFEVAHGVSPTLLKCQ